jgi:hypothetical protein
MKNKIIKINKYSNCFSYIEVKNRELYNQDNLFTIRKRLHE